MARVRSPHEGRSAMTVEPTIRIFAEPRIAMRRNDDGSLVLTSREPLAAHVSDLAAPLYRWAAERPDAPLAAERAGAGWRRLSYEEAVHRAEAVGAALLD